MTFLSTVFAKDIDIGPKAEEAGVSSVENIGNLIGAGVGTAFLISFLLVFVMLVWGGIQWVTSGGDKENTQKARDRITHALVGVAIIGGAWALMKLVELFFGVNILSGFDLPKATQ
jgi:hypothetical protein